MLWWIVAATAAGGLLSAAAAGGFLLLSEPLRARLMPGLISFATGALLGAALLALIPHALESGIDAHRLSGTVLAGLLIFFVLEKMVLWRHSHDHHHDHHHGGAAPTASAAGHLILIGDSIHNLVDGVLIASAFLTDIRLGVLTSLAVVAHEIPQEVGDFAILLHSGFSRMRAFVYNMLASATMVLGGLLAYFFLSTASALVPYVLALAAASFIYVAVADLIPSLHRRVHARAIVAQTLLIVAGIALIFVAELTLH